MAGQDKLHQRIFRIGIRAEDFIHRAVEDARYGERAGLRDEAAVHALRLAYPHERDLLFEEKAMKLVAGSRVDGGRKPGLLRVNGFRLADARGIQRPYGSI